MHLRHLEFHELSAGCWRYEFSIEVYLYIVVFVDVEKLLPVVNFVSVEKFQF